ncbi:MAG: plasmid encoded RepA protein [Edaphobacter sp.]|nr:plasmid encoded RepA protein [Edaphobacter sp.]
MAASLKRFQSLNGDLGLVLSIECVKVGRRVIVVIHADHDSEKDAAVREQAWRLFTCTVSITADLNEADEHRKRLSKMLIAEDIELWWTSKATSQNSLWESRLELSQKFFDYLIDKPVPIDWEAVRQLRRSPLALDLYFWLTHRMSYLCHQTTIAWVGPGSLAEQLGSNYGDDRFGRRDFRLHIMKQLKNVLSVYSTAKLEASDIGLTLLPSPTHVPRKIAR